LLEEKAVSRMQLNWKLEKRDTAVKGGKLKGASIGSTTIAESTDLWRKRLQPTKLSVI